MVEDGPAWGPWLPPPALPLLLLLEGELPHDDEAAREGELAFLNLKNLKQHYMTMVVGSLVRGIG